MLQPELEEEDGGGPLDSIVKAMANVELDDADVDVEVDVEVDVDAVPDRKPHFWITMQLLHRITRIIMATI